MRVLLATTALLVLSSTVAQAQAEDVESVALEAGVSPVDLAGASATTGLEPREYLMVVGELARPWQWPTGRLGCIARVESHNDPGATNPRSGAAGLFQFLYGTWMTTPQGKAGLSRYDPVAATAAAEWMMRAGRINEWVAVSGGWC